MYAVPPEDTVFGLTATTVEVLLKHQSGLVLHYNSVRNPILNDDAMTAAHIIFSSQRPE